MKVRVMPRGVGHGQHAPGGDRAQVLLRRRFDLAIAGIVGPVGERRRAVLETDDEFLALLAGLLCDEVAPGLAGAIRMNTPVLALGGLNVATSTLRCSWRA